MWKNTIQNFFLNVLVSFHRECNWHKFASMHIFINFWKNKKRKMKGTVLCNAIPLCHFLKKGNILEWLHIRLDFFIAGIQTYRIIIAVLSCRNIIVKWMFQTSWEKNDVLCCYRRLEMGNNNIFYIVTRWLRTHLMIGVLIVSSWFQNLTLKL